MRIKKGFFFLFFYTVLLLLFSCSNSNNTKPNNSANADSLALVLKKINAKEKAYKLDTLFSNWNKHRGFNGSVLVAQKGIVIYTKQFGYADMEKKIKLDSISSFQLASVSKPLTAIAILILKDSGLLQLDQKVEQIISGFPYPNVTIKDLLSHRSGLPNYMYFCDSLYCCKNDLLTNESVINMMIEHKPNAYWQPNKKFEYCNTNYLLLASIIEKVSGLSYAEFMKTYIFKPLQMNQSWVSIAKTNYLHKNSTRGHKSSGKHEGGDYLDGVVGDKNIYSTATDLFKLDKALYAGKLLKPETLQESYLGYSNEKKGKRNYGLGWRIKEEEKDSKIIYHNGWWHGYNNVFSRRLKDSTTIIILSNRINRSVYQIGPVYQVLDGTKVSAVEEEE